MEKNSVYSALERVEDNHGVALEEVLTEIGKALAQSTISNPVVMEKSALEAVAYFRDIVIERMNK